MQVYLFSLNIEKFEKYIFQLLTFIHDKLEGHFREVIRFLGKAVNVRFFYLPVSIFHISKKRKKTFWPKTAHSFFVPNFTRNDHKTQCDMCSYLWPIKY